MCRSDMASKKLRLFITEDHLLIRDGLRAILCQQTDMEIVGEASEGQEAIRKAPGLNPDVILMDVSMPGMGGVQATQTLRKLIPEAKILALTAHEDSEHMSQMLRAGASGYILKRAAARHLIQAIHTVAAGGLYLDATLGSALLTQEGRASHATDSIDKATLSSRESAVLRLIAEGYSNKEIGAKMDLSVKTVETYKARLMKKLGLHSRTEIVRYALQQGWLDIA